MSKNDDFPPGTEHLYLDETSWAFYEHLLEQIGDRHRHVTFIDGELEIISPIMEHESVKCVMRSIIGNATMEFGLPLKSFGSTTFRREDRNAGLEPDVCYYVTNWRRALGMKRFDPTVHPPPDLAIDIDIYSRFIDRLPVYARLGVPEVWRYDEARLAVNLLTPDGTYTDSKTSGIFPLMPIDQTHKFVSRMNEESQNEVTREFQLWVRELAKASWRIQPSDLRSSK